MKIWRQRAEEDITMSNNILAVLIDKYSLLEDIMSQIFEGDWRTAFHHDQSGTGYGYEVWCIEINGRMGWFRPSDNMPPTKGKAPNIAPVPLMINQPPEPVIYNTVEKSSLSFLSRLFRF